MLNLPHRLEVRGILCAAALALAGVGSAAAVDLKLERRAADAGKARVCVTMDSKGADVAGTQNDISFDTSCASLAQTDCVASKHHGKPLHGSIPPHEPSTFRSLVFALDNVDPMNDGEVYCCDFSLKGEGDGCCAVSMGRLGASDPQGVALDVTASPERLCLIGDAPAPPAGDPPAAAAAPAPDSAGAASSPNWLWVVGLAAAVLAVLFFALRKAG
jgi:hypothetical protein